MRSNSAIQKIANEIYGEITASLATLTELRKTQVAALANMGVDDGLVSISNLISDVEAVIKAPTVDGVGLPNFLSKITITGDNIDFVNVRVGTKLKSAYKYRKDAKVATDENFIKAVGKVYLDALYEMFYIEEAIANVSELNAKLAEVIAENEIPYGFEFAVDVDTDAMVLYVDNNKVVFNASVSKAQDIANIGLLASGDEYSDFVAAQAKQKLVEALKATQTPVQLIKSNIDIIKQVTGQSTKKRASKLIRGSYHRQAKYLNGVKAGVGYFEATVTINGEETDIFALVSKDEEGKLEVVLNPFDVKTLFNVEYDVLAALNAQA